MKMLINHLPLTSRSVYHMPGTEGTGTYIVFAVTPRGKIGVREFAPGLVRIRVEPTAVGRASLANALTSGKGWKQPDGRQNRFSRVVRGVKSEEMMAHLTEATHALVGGGNVPTHVNSRAPAFLRNLVTTEGLVSALRAKKVKGSNLASAWPVKTVCKKLNG